ncbi:hypothetical protein [Candidatus Poriferisodalis sp.]|uniref:hypothetical protein n=1 Tax=Candidatus Poriferisodalis sp. TaxID=3101277 RepID=UPI003C6FE474
MVVDAESVSDTTVWDVLGGIGGLAAGVSLLILVYIQARPRVNRWALTRFLHATVAYELRDRLTNEQTRDLTWRHRLRRWRRNQMFEGYQRLMTMSQRVKARQLESAFMSARSKLVGTWAPDDLVLPDHLTEEERSMLLEAAAVSRMREERHRLRRLMRARKGVRCAGGCGTRYGKRHRDHDFHGGGGIEGGWRCSSKDSCRTKATGDHFCGMCALKDKWEDAVSI